MCKKFLVLFLVFCVAVNASQLHLRRQPFQLSHEITYSSKNNIGGGIAGFIVAPILFVYSFILIWNSERKAAIDHRRMGLAQSIVREVNCQNPMEIGAANGMLVHTTGVSRCNQTVVDPQSGICLSEVVKIKRSVEVYEIRSVGSDKNQRYQPMWVSQNRTSPGGGHSNDPGCWFIQSGETKANNIYVGNYLLSESLKDKHQCKNTYTPTIEHAYNIARKYPNRVRNEPVIQQGYIYFPTSQAVLASQGTLRVKYSYCSLGPTSIMSQSNENTFTPFRIDIYQNGKPDTYTESSGNCCCFLSDCTAKLMAPITQIDLLAQSTETSEQMIERQNKNIKCKKNLMRVLAYAIMVASICAFFSPITTILGYVPLLGGLLSNIVGLAIFLAALIVCIPLFLLAVGICWLIVHPKVGVAILGVALLATGIVLAIIFINRGKGSQAQQTVKHLAISLRSINLS